MIEDVWKSARTVKEDKTCGRCYRVIEKTSPGATSGTRGTKAFVNFARREWQCMECRAIESRAENARVSLDDLLRRAVPVNGKGEEFDVVLNSFGAIVNKRGLTVFAEAISTGTVEALNALKVGKLGTPSMEVFP